jgi:fumarate hydratase class I
MGNTIKKQDFIDSIRAALQYISYYHPPDFIRAMAEAWERDNGLSVRTPASSMCS